MFLFQRYANVTEKQPCVFELSTYSEIDVSGTGFLNTVVRDNCETARVFCDTTTQVCERLRLVGQQCQYHRDCQSVHFSVLYFADLGTLRWVSSTIASEMYVLAHLRSRLK